MNYQVHINKRLIYIRSLPRNLKIRFVVSFLYKFVSSSLVPFMALFLAEDIGSVKTGVFLSITVGSTFFSSLLGGALSDRYGRKKILTFTSVVIFLIFLSMTSSLYGNNGVNSLFLLCYLLYMMFQTLGRPSLEAIIVDSTTKENRKQVYTIDYWSNNLAIALGTVMGGILFEVSHQLLFIINSILSLIISILIMLVLTEINIQKLNKIPTNIIKESFYNYKIAIKDKAFALIVFGSLLLFTTEFSLTSYTSIRLEKEFFIEFSTFDISGVIMLSILRIQNTLIILFFTFFILKISGRFPQKTVLIFGLCIYTLGYSVITYDNNFFVLLIMNLLATIGELIYSPIVKAEKANMMPENLRGSYSAFSGLSLSGADLLARLTIILGVFVIPEIMGLIIGFLSILGTILLYLGLYVFKRAKYN